MTLSLVARAEAPEARSSQDQEQALSAGEPQAEEGVCGGAGGEGGAQHPAEPAAQREGGAAAVGEQVSPAAGAAAAGGGCQAVPDQAAGRDTAHGPRPLLLSYLYALAEAS